MDVFLVKKLLKMREIEDRSIVVDRAYLTVEPVAADAPKAAKFSVVDQGTDIRPQFKKIKIKKLKQLNEMDDDFGDDTSINGAYSLSLTHAYSLNHLLTYIYLLMLSYSLTS